MAPISYRRHRFPPVVIQRAVWLYLRFTLSYRDVEELLAERGLDISYVYDGAPVTIMSEAAATLCNHRVTFDIDRASAGGSFVWLFVEHCQPPFSLWAPARSTNFRRSTIRWFGIPARCWMLQTTAPTLICH